MTELAMLLLPRRRLALRPAAVVRSWARGLVAGGLWVGLALQPAQAQAPYPSQALKVVTPFTRGGAADVALFALTDALGAALKQPVQLHHEPGSGGAAAARWVAGEPADGYTLLIGSDSAVTVMPAVRADLSYRAEDFKPVMVIGSAGMLLVAHPSSGVKTLQELRAKGDAVEWHYSSSGNGSYGHLVTAALATQMGLKLAHVPYRAVAPAVGALVSGEVQLGVFPVASVVQQIKAGQLVPLAFSGGSRTRIFPQVPTLIEAGLKGARYEALFLVMARSSTPEAALAVLRRAMERVLAKPEIKEYMLKLDLHLEALTGQAAEDRVSQVQQNNARAVRVHNIRMD